MDINQLVEEGLIAEAEWVAETTSTNSVLLSSEVTGRTPDGVVLFGADRQTAGRGRRGNRWEATDGALTFSLLLPRAHASELMPIRVALAVADSLSDLGLNNAMVKWPNDVLVGRKKISGILIEDAVERGFVVGVGINVRNRARQHAVEVQKNMTSIVDELAANGDAIPAETTTSNDLRYRTLRSVLTRFREWMAMPVDYVVREARRRDPFANRPVILFDGPNREVRLQGTSRSVVSTGAYAIETADGAVVDVHSGTLRLDD